MPFAVCSLLDKVVDARNALCIVSDAQNANCEHFAPVRGNRILLRLERNWITIDHMTLHRYRQRILNNYLFIRGTVKAVRYSMYEVVIS